MNFKNQFLKWYLKYRIIIKFKFVDVMLSTNNQNTWEKRSTCTFTSDISIKNKRPMSLNGRLSIRDSTPTFHQKAHNRPPSVCLIYAQKQKRRVSMIHFWIKNYLPLGWVSWNLQLLDSLPYKCYKYQTWLNIFPVVLVKILMHNTRLWTSTHSNWLTQVTQNQ